MENIEFDCFSGLKVGDTVYCGYFYAPEDFIPNKHIYKGVVVELDDYNYAATIACVDDKRFITVPQHCYNKAENKNYIDYQDFDSEHEDVYMCYGTDESKVRFQLSFKALALIREEYDKAKKKVQELEISISRLEKEIGAKLK